MKDSVTFRAASRLTARARRVVGFGLLFLATGGVANAVPSGVPEIDPGSMSSALALLGLGVLMLSGRRRRK